MNDNKKIAVNTIILTIKMVISLVCNFVVSRLILQALGADNYGLYSVVGGIVGMLTVMSTSMIATTNRYIVVEIGKGATGDPRRIYSTLMLIHVVLAILLVVIGEPLGALYINKYLNVTHASIADAQFVFFFSLIATFFTIIAIPSNGLLMAQEKFFPIAVIDISRSLLNVVIALILLDYAGNRLRLYAVLMAALTIGNRIAFHLYCRYNYPSVVKFRLNKNLQEYRGILSFTGWMLLGTSAVVGRTQGVALVINLFFRNAINAAFGVASQISHATTMFTNTLRQSVSPQIMKNQGANPSRSLYLVYAISRYTYLIMLVIAVPLLLIMSTVLQLWLGVGNVPPMTEAFTSFLLLGGMISNLKTGFDASIQATGIIKKNQIGYAVINLSIIPIVFVLYKIGFPAYISVIVGIFLTIVTIIFQASIMQEQTEFKFKDYWRKTIEPALLATVFALVPMISIRLLIGKDVYLLISFAIISAIWTCLSAFFVGMTKHERTSIVKYVKNKIKRKTN